RASTGNGRRSRRRARQVANRTAAKPGGSRRTSAKRATAPAAARGMSQPGETPRPGAGLVEARGTQFKVAATKVAGVKRTLNVFPDLPDIRDRHYEPTLAILQPRLLPPM